MSKITTKDIRRTLSETESNVLTDLSFHDKYIFTSNDIKLLIKNPKNILDSLVKKKWIVNIKRGVYAIVPFDAGIKGADSYTLHEFIIGSLLTKPYYIGYYSALNYYRFTDMLPNKTYVATTNPKANTRILNADIQFVTIQPHKMFDVHKLQIENREVNISSPEKTFIDCLDHPQYAGGVEEVAKALFFSHDELDLKKLANFAIQIKNTAVIKRLGYLSELFELDECLEILSKAHISKRYLPLEPFVKELGKTIERWQLGINLVINPDRWIRRLPQKLYEED